MSKSNRGYYAMIYRSILQCMVIVLVGLPAWAQQQDEARSQSLHVYFIGNSLTDTIRYESFATLAESRDQSIVWGRHMIPGAPLEWIHSHADSGFMQEPFGHYPKALGEFVWDAVSVQPFDRQLHSNDADGGCHFYQPEGPFVPKSFVDPGYPVIFCDGNGLTVSGCDFTGFNRNHIVLGPKSKSTIVSATRFLGGLPLTNQGHGKVVTTANIDE